MTETNFYGEYRCRRCGTVQFEEEEKNLLNNAFICRDCLRGVACLEQIHSTGKKKKKPIIFETYERIKGLWGNQD